MLPKKPNALFCALVALTLLALGATPRSEAHPVRLPQSIVLILQLQDDENPAPVPNDTTPIEVKDFFASDINEWLAEQVPFSMRYMFGNIHPAGTVPGTVVAGTSKINPPYFFHCASAAAHAVPLCTMAKLVDLPTHLDYTAIALALAGRLSAGAALTMDVVVTLYSETTNPSDESRYEELLWSYATLSRENQRAPACVPFVRNICEAKGGPGEVKFNPDGSVYAGPWGRFQNDGPALRASTLIRFASAYMKKGGDVGLVKQLLYDSVLPSRSVIKVDLEYVSHEWNNVNFDLWEEIPAQHFFTRMVQRRALLEGAAFARTMEDPHAATWYESQARLLEAKINEHWSSYDGFIREMIDTPFWYSRRAPNIATVLAVIHGYNHDGYYSPINEQVLATVDQLRQDFEDTYPIAKIKVDPATVNTGKPLVLGTPFGRYREDIYDGSQGMGGQTAGNPWFLTTLAVAELFYQAIAEYESIGSISVTPISLRFFQGIEAKDVAVGETYTKSATGTPGQFEKIIETMAQVADNLIRRVKYHVGPTRRMAEQFNRHFGFQCSAEDLTWSYASVLTTNFARNKLALKLA
ncbi:glycoside hydrolase 15 protein [Quaeritorhiza haematococci]|nr:glycoside hydrolase 15 protein [Quaeritorhiza haematococci]